MVLCLILQSLKIMVDVLKIFFKIKMNRKIKYKKLLQKIILKLIKNKKYMVFQSSKLKKAFKIFWDMFLQIILKASFKNKNNLKWKAKKIKSLHRKMFINNLINKLKQKQITKRNWQVVFLVEKKPPINRVGYLILVN